MKQPFKCPVCNGNGLVPNGFYISATGICSTNATTPETCRSCNGSGIVWTEIAGVHDVDEFYKESE